MKLLVATTNRNKLDEIRTILAGLPITIATLDDHPGISEPAETGDTFVANARLKAVHYSTFTGRTSVAEDSGLEIDALGGAPGVRSSRFNGAAYPEKFAAIYAQLRERGAAGARLGSFVPWRLRRDSRSSSRRAVRSKAGSRRPPVVLMASATTQSSSTPHTNARWPVCLQSESCRQPPRQGVSSPASLPSVPSQSFITGTDPRTERPPPRGDVTASR